MNFYEYPSVKAIPHTKDEVDKLIEEFSIDDDNQFIVHPKIDGVPFQIELSTNNRYYGSSYGYYNNTNNFDIYDLQKFMEENYGQFLDKCCNENSAYLTLYFQAFGSHIKPTIDYQTEKDVVLYDINTCVPALGTGNKRVLIPFLQFTVISYVLKHIQVPNTIKDLPCFPVRNIKNLLYELVDIIKDNDGHIDTENYVFKSSHIEQLSFNLPHSYFAGGFIIKPYNKIVINNQSQQLLLKVQSSEFQQ